MDDAERPANSAGGAVNLGPVCGQDMGAPKRFHAFGLEAKPFRLAGSILEQSEACAGARPEPARKIRNRVRSVLGSGRGGSNSVVESQPSKLLVAGSIPASRSRLLGSMFGRCSSVGRAMLS